MNSPAIKWVSWCFCILTGIIVSLKNLREPDIWWMLKAGEWMIAHNSFIRKDLFSFTFYGSEWISVKWAFELLLVVFKKMGGPEFTVMIQAIVNSLLILFLLKQYNQFKKILFNKVTSIPSAAIIISTYLFIFVATFRMIGRPEMISHLMTAIFSFLLIKYRFYPSISIYWIILLQIIWVNFHEAYGIGMVMMTIFTMSCLIEYYYMNKKQESGDLIFPKHLIIASLSAIGGVALNPNGPKMILHPLNIFLQTKTNKFTSELLDYTQPAYWNKEAYMNIGIFFMICLILFFLKRKSNVSVQWYKRRFTVLGLGYCILLAAFFYLSLNMYRNIPFVNILGIPLFAIGIGQFFQFIENHLRFKKLIASSRRLLFPVLILFGCVVYYYIGSGKFFKQFHNREAVGLKINPLYHPLGAAEFIREHKISGNCFSDFLTSSYLLWALYPQFKTYIDLRDLDVFDESFFREFIKISFDPTLIERKDSMYNFSFAVIYRPQFQSIHQYLYNHPEWEPVFADPIAAIYVKNLPKHAAIISEYGMKFNDKDGFLLPKEIKPTNIAKTTTRLFWPLYDENKSEIYDYDKIAASYYLSVGQLDWAEERAIKSTNNNIENWSGFEMLGNIYLSYFDKATDTKAQLAYLSKAENSFLSAIDDNMKASNSLYGLGIIYMQRQKWGNAMFYFKKCVEYDNKYLKAYISMAECQNAMAAEYPSGSERYLQNWIKYMEKAQSLNPNNPMIMLQLGIAYCKTGDCGKAKKQLKYVLDIPEMPHKDVEFARACLLNCAN